MLSPGDLKSVEHQQFIQRTQTLLFQKDILRAVREKDISKVKELLSKEELDINFIYSSPVGSIEVW